MPIEDLLRMHLSGGSLMTKPPSQDRFLQPACAQLKSRQRELPKLPDISIPSQRKQGAEVSTTQFLHLNVESQSIGNQSLLASKSVDFTSDTSFAIQMQEKLWSKFNSSSECYTNKNMSKTYNLPPDETSYTLEPSTVEKAAASGYLRRNRVNNICSVCSKESSHGMRGYVALFMHNNVLYFIIK